MSVFAFIIAAFVFVLAGLGVHVGDLSELDLIAFASGLFALGHVLPNA